MKTRLQSVAFATFAVLVMSPGAAPAQATDTLRIPVDGHRLFLLSSGTGSPTVILESGDASTHRAWNTLRPEIAKFTRVVAYDRAGLGQSEFSSQPRTAQVIARELHAALTTANIRPPYVLVGHSAGGLFVRVFASLFPETVVGVVLLDPAPEDVYARAERELPALHASLDSADRAGRVNATPGQRAEDDAWETTLVQARASDATFRAPVVLLSSPRQDLGAMSDLFREEQRRWTERQARATFRVVSGTGHAIQRDRPDTVLTVIKSFLLAKRP